MRECEIDVHDLEPQLVCEECGHRESLPPGTVVLSAAQVEQVRESVQAVSSWLLASNGAQPYQRGRHPRLDGLLDVLALLGEQTT